MKIKLFFGVILGLSIVACGDKSTESNEEGSVSQMKLAIQEMDDSLMTLTQRVLEEKDFKIERLVYHESINRNIAFYKAHPKDEFAPFALEKAASMYMALRIDELAADWRDSIIVNYPDFKNILDILELQKAHYDNFDVYEPTYIKKYAEMMLANDKLSKDKREDLEFRLEHIDKSFMDLIRMQNPELDF